MTRRAIEAIRAQHVVAIVRETSEHVAYETAVSLADAGVRALEVSLVTPGALATIARLRAELASEVVVGVGTAMTVDDVVGAAEVGAEFVVSPVSDPLVIAATKAAGLGSVPGAATPTEAVSAVRAGADLVKIFPATTWSPAAVRDVLSALPDLPLVPTGGVGLEGAAEWIAAGSAAVGMGSALSRCARAHDDARIRSLLAALAAASGRSR